MSGSARARVTAAFFHPAKWRPAVTRAVALALACPLGTNVTLADGWDGTAWRVQATPNPAHGTYSILEGVSCVSPADCTAVGYHGRDGTPQRRWP